jgi:hypothetical protein
MIVNLKLSVEIVNRLSAKAAQAGQTLEGLLEHLAEQEAGLASKGQADAAQSPGDEGRPWRGTFVLDYPRQDVFAITQEVNVNVLPPLPRDVRIDPRRLAD